ncbi:carbon storage regulator [Siminovitchia fortis]|uniref:Carbon storage regulator n=1 Tax=Siminovitchia fortis TaxID=254758 RepID=A0A443IL67_9BACI|nr:carbon storage regulator [Siminovitchia fortis]RWR05680.1 carbon storage regulator [Siminovitchia fortis]WHY82229.1 carbon storage regulator [Siminovitchia fortis]
MALVVGRKAGEAIILENSRDDTQMRIEVIKEDGLLRLKIEAPKHIQIYREEIYGEQRKNRL